MAHDTAVNEPSPQSKLPPVYEILKVSQKFPTDPGVTYQHLFPNARQWHLNQSGGKPA